MVAAGGFEPPTDGVADCFTCPFSKPHPRLRIGMEVVLEVEGSQFDTTAGPSHR
jgi:hypothetical protein